MQVVLRKDVPKLGNKGEVVNVRDGFFRNFLYPNGMAVYASVSEVKRAELYQKKLVLDKKRLLDQADELLVKLEGVKLKITSKATDKGKLYASIHEDDVVGAIKDKVGIELDKSMLKMEHFKEVGHHEVEVHLGDKSVKIKIEVIAK